MSRETVLIVEDDETPSSSLAVCLENSGYAVARSETAVEALRKILDHTFDFLVTGIDIPHMNGHVLANTAVRMKPKLRIILMSACGFPPGHSRYPHLTKPFKVSKLLRVMKGLRRAAPAQRSSRGML